MTETNGKVENEVPEAEIPENEKVYQSFDFKEEFSELGKAFSDAMSRAWNSKERYEIEQEVRDGLRRFADEIEHTAKRVREGELRNDVKDNVQKVREDIETGKVSQDIRKGTADALRNLRDALDKMADSFTPAEDEAPAE